MRRTKRVEVRRHGKIIGWIHQSTHPQWRRFMALPVHDGLPSVWTFSAMKARRALLMQREAVES